jgi:predicted HNH restriction endonuclease
MTRVEYIAYIKQWKIQNRKKWRALIREYGLTKCSICGYDKCAEAIHLHHKNTSDKELDISNFIGKRSFSLKNVTLVKKELSKVTALCANCHIELHAKEWNLNSKSRE